LTRRAVGAALCVLASAVLFPTCFPKPSALSANVLTGTASWYGPDFHGKPTSNREIYNMYDLTAAHKTLPFGTRVMVTNLLNAKTVQVRINDRGPFVGDRIIDLSYAAARLLDLVGPGTAPVRLDILGQSPPPASPFRFSVQVGAFTIRNNAQQQVQELAALQDLPRAVLSEYRTSTQAYYRVRIPASSGAEAQAIARRLAEAGFQVIVLEE
jgi:rare lipoprotein A